MAHYKLELKGHPFYVGSFYLGIGKPKAEFDCFVAEEDVAQVVAFPCEFEGAPQPVFLYAEKIQELTRHRDEMIRWEFSHLMGSHKITLARLKVDVAADRMMREIRR